MILTREGGEETVSSHQSMCWPFKCPINLNHRGEKSHCSIDEVVQGVSGPVDRIVVERRQGQGGTHQPLVPEESLCVRRPVV